VHIIATQTDIRRIVSECSFEGVEWAATLKGIATRTRVPNSTQWVRSDISVWTEFYGRRAGNGGIKARCDLERLQFWHWERLRNFADGRELVLISWCDMTT
jgi:hypothetical protein